MNRLMLSLMLVLGLVAGHGAVQGAAADQAEPVGLASFKFGSTWTQLREQAIREYGLEKVKGIGDSWRQPRDKGKLYFSFQFVRLDGGAATREFVIDHYMVAGKEYEVHFVFDARERFYAYRMIEIPSVDLKDYETVVGERFRRWQEIFEKQFGPPGRRGTLPDPQGLQVPYTPVTLWKFKTHTASVGVFHRGRSYNAQAVVQDDTLAGEESARKSRQ